MPTGMGSLVVATAYGVVRCALGWACWKTYLGRPETDVSRRNAMTELGNGLLVVDRYADALTVQEAELTTLRRAPIYYSAADEEAILMVQGNLAITYEKLGRLETALCLKRDVYSGRLKLYGEEHRETLRDAFNYAGSFVRLRRFGEAKSLLCKTIPVVRRVMRDSSEVSIRMRVLYAQALYIDASATLDDIREAATTLEEIEQTARRVLGGAHPLTSRIEAALRDAQAALHASEAGERVVFVQRK